VSSFFSASLVTDGVLWFGAQVAYSCTYELRPYLDLLLQMLLLEDSWQNHRIHNALKGEQNNNNKTPMLW